MINFKDLSPGMILYDLVDNSTITSGYILYLEFIKEKTSEYVVYDRIIINNGHEVDSPKRITQTFNEKAWVKGWILTNGSAKEIQTGQMRVVITSLFDKNG
jgi:hypothetical protein